MAKWRRKTWVTVNLWDRGSIPRSPGVYVFIKNGRAVYVGQSINLFDRFSAYCAYRPKRVFPRVDFGDHFDDSCRLPERLNGATAKISVSRRYGDWLMREVRLIRRLQPEWNRTGIKPHFM